MIFQQNKYVKSLQIKGLFDLEGVASLILISYSLLKSRSDLLIDSPTKKKKNVKTSLFVSKVFIIKE